MGRIVHVGGPWFEDLKVGQVFDEAPPTTLTSGHAALFAAITGDRLRLPLDAELCRAVTGNDAPLAHPTLVCNISIGHSTVATQRVRANLFYRNLILLRPVYVGDTLTTRAEVAALKQNRSRSGRPPTGLAALRIRTENQRGEPVLDFWRCPMLPLKDPTIDTGHADTFDDIPAELSPDAVVASVPRAWELEPFRRRAGGPRPGDLAAGTTYAVDGRDTVTSAPELVRATLNLAAAHTDAAASEFGRRLVYGGHTVALAGAHVVRALPSLMTILAWRSCDHTAPVFEGDVLRTEVTVDAISPIFGGGALVDLHAIVFASRDEQPEVPVLDWRPIGLLA